MALGTKANIVLNTEYKELFKAICAIFRPIYHGLVSFGVLQNKSKLE